MSAFTACLKGQPGYLAAARCANTSATKYQWAIAPRNFRSRRAKIICVSVLKAVQNSAIPNLGQYCCLI